MGFEVHFFKLIKRRILEGMPALWKVLPEDCFQSIPKGEKGNTPPKSNRQPENKSAWKQKTPFLSDFSIYHQFSGFYVKKLSLLGMWQGPRDWDIPWLRRIEASRRFQSFFDAFGWPRSTKNRRSWGVLVHLEICLVSVKPWEFHGCNVYMPSQEISTKRITPPNS